ncbi:MAG: class II glutamine amidotransferase [Chloroflexi bacterium]|nr:MAG: class II glutamine amidotransferase [Chloroflexota bacterium]
MFRHRSEPNRHGWGLAVYPDNSCQIIKEPIKAEDSKLSGFLTEYKPFKSKIFIGHVRYSTHGSISHCNTHPFSRELHGREYVFAHNGTIHDYQSLPVSRFHPIGETDSEWAFCHLLEQLCHRNITAWNENHFKWLAGVLNNINNHGNFNCLFSDGEYLFCYHDTGGYNGLRFVHRKPPFQIHVMLKDEDVQVDLSREKSQDQHGYVIASKPLTDEDWDSFDAGELIVFRSGEMVYSNKREAYTQPSV